MAYGGGLRASEVTHLKVGDFDSDRMLIQIEQGIVAIAGYFTFIHGSLLSKGYSS